MEADATAGARLVVFLGNTGERYRLTRHNAGWIAAESLSFADALVWRQKFKGRYATHGGRVFLLPETLMNRSGDSVAPCMSFYRIAASELVVVHDDVEIAFGRVERKRGGGMAGHNGLRDIVRVAGADFFRIRIGIGRPPRGDMSSFVLSRFSPEEEAELPPIMQRAAALVEDFLR
jgi:peptidyl-tRNA hydrolase, PTH1 family